MYHIDIPNNLTKGTIAMVHLNSNPFPLHLHQHRYRSTVLQCLLVLIQRKSHWSIFLMAWPLGFSFNSPCCTARESAVRPSLFCAFISAPIAINNFTRFSCPYEMHNMEGWVIGIIIKCVNLMSPSIAAQWSGVFPFVSVAVMFAFFSINSLAMFSRPNFSLCRRMNQTKIRRHLKRNDL